MPFTLPLDARAPDFHLPGTDGRMHSLADFSSANVLVVAFTCNHCPYVIGSEDRLIAFADDYGPRGVKLVCINSNEEVDHPADDFAHMVGRAKSKGFPFPYLRDEDQSVALAYGALRTPHFYAFDSHRKLRYTGRMDDNPKDASKATTRELRDAVAEMLSGKRPSVPLTNPLGCNVKWKGEERHWMPAEACDLV